jgi:hypothetical protein
MARRYIPVDAEVCIDEFDDDVIIEEAKKILARRKEDFAEEVVDSEEYFDRAIYELKRNNHAEAFVYLERAIPELKGLLPRLEK